MLSGDDCLHESMRPRNRDLGAEYQQGIFDMLRGAKDFWLKSGMGLINPNNPVYKKTPQPKNLDELRGLLDDPDLEYLPSLDPGGLMRGMTKVFHGSPHLFKNWDFSKMGSGEGAQAYGHGGYFAGNKGVGQYYVDKLSDLKSGHSYQSVPFNNEPELSAIIKKRLNKLSKDRDQFLSSNPSFSIPTNVEKSKVFEHEIGKLEFFQELIEKFRKQSASGEPSFDQFLKNEIELSKNYSPLFEQTKKKAEYLKDLKPGELKVNLGKSGHLYEIELKPDPEDFPMYDVPLKDQPMAMEKINAAKNRLEALKKERDWTLSQIQEKKKQPGYVSELPDQYKWADEMFIPEEDFPKLKPIDDEIQKLQSALSIVDHPERSIMGLDSPRDKAGFKTPEWKPSAVIAEAFRTVGFPGHRFLDGMSRSGRRPEKNFNYVVYPTDDPDMIKITNPPQSLLD